MCILRLLSLCFLDFINTDFLVSGIPQQCQASLGLGRWFLLLSLSLPPPYSFFLPFIMGSDLSSPWFVRKARNQLSRSAWVLLFLLLLLFSTVICMFEFFFFKFRSVRVYCIFTQLFFQGCRCSLMLIGALSSIVKSWHHRTNICLISKLI